ncbi:TPA: bifunctional 3-deoxy-7-phosphoheptulonate synthase/chorismate mutase [Bacillus thuringiensis]|uniref:bifunctional 3-deoxy-7-phosphoheptulonate synthase/chorismate mutase n=1 Tax=Bacillus TaxID=1386 RepID=UPI00027A9778|nr:MULTISPECIES: bifunctional 3-deoxy-7-phosphoheptulonate synthase/chorismate mutase [Bacillus]EJS45862.1 phospho-2-dehydro-3-deoxyheptonate aldolase [Bacillus cereus BAG1X1-2]MED3621186.1 bifunctional 3-deoxy-7-phosphoheptulonate synthase/chorismate mutase [Bacillus thuringiensis]PER40653.1 3-deoxy-7-phosphoheptulonate synthase [Bacillus thuringiensis]PEW81638.1 3-deoxy-7-phosphoheptulonate synthase [Bacillus thuringiensis]PWE75166.1 bifunctional 3-deoxy-7-phosphoheptulonate synthase/chorism
MSNTDLQVVENKIDEIDVQLLKLLKVLNEREILDNIVEKNADLFDAPTMKDVFKTIFKEYINLQEANQLKTLLVSRKAKSQNTIIDIKGVKFGNGEQNFIMGPCAVESIEQVRIVAEAMREQGVKLMRGGAFKPRTSPYDFQGLGVEGLEILRQVADEYDLAVISEIVNPSEVEIALQYVDVIQIGARNMQNFELLKAVGCVNKPVLLKRGLSATIDEFIHAAEYIILQGNNQIILCERGIRTYEKATRNTLDISAIPILKKDTHLPVIVDVTHSTGRKDLLLPTAKAALAIGADAVMAEVHPDPAVALSDSAQQMDITQFNDFMNELNRFINKLA